jgi:V/A-type H+-transporting ATPase subunit E
MNQVQELEQAILARAERLAAEYRERAHRKRDVILRDAAERLRLREQREEDLAKSLGERLVTDVERRLRERMRRFMADEAAYLASLEAYLKDASRQIESDDLVAELGSSDHRLLADRWEAIAATAAPGKSLRLAPEPIETLGGALVRSADNRIRVDHTFEGRLERLRNRIRQVIMERLLPAGLDTGNLFAG